MISPAPAISLAGGNPVFTLNLHQGAGNTTKHFSAGLGCTSTSPQAATAAARSSTNKALRRLVLGFGIALIRCKAGNRGYHGTAERVRRG